MLCVQVGQTVFSSKNLRSEVAVDTLLDTLPFKVPSFLRLLVAFDTSVILSEIFDNSSFRASLFSSNCSFSTINPLRIFFLFLILSCPCSSSSLIKFFCMVILSVKDSFFKSKTLILSLVLRILSLTIEFIEEKILISRMSSMTSLRPAAGNCMKGTKVLLPRITI